MPFKKSKKLLEGRIKNKLVCDDDNEKKHKHPHICKQIYNNGLHFYIASLRCFG